MQSRPGSLENNPEQSSGGFLPASLENLIAGYLTFSELEAYKRTYSDIEAKEMNEDKEVKVVEKTSRLPFFKTDQDIFPDLRPYIQVHQGDPEMFADAGIQVINRLFTEEDFKSYSSFAEVKARITGIQLVYTQMNFLEGLYDLNADICIGHTKITKPVGGPTLADVSDELKKMQQRIKEEKNPDVSLYSQQIQKMALTRIEELRKVYNPEEFKSLFLGRTENHIKEKFNPSSKIQLFNLLWEFVSESLSEKISYLGDDKIFARLSGLTDEELFFLVNLVCKGGPNTVYKNIRRLESEITRHWLPERNPLRMRVILAYCRNQFHPLKANWFIDFNFILDRPEIYKEVMQIKGFFSEIENDIFEKLIRHLMSTNDLVRFKKILDEYGAKSREHIDLVSSWDAYAFLTEMVRRDAPLESYLFKKKSSAKSDYHLYEFVFDSYFNPKTNDPMILADIEKLFLVTLEKICQKPDRYAHRSALKYLSEKILDPKNAKLVLDTAKKHKIFLQLNFANPDVYYHANIPLPVFVIKKGNPQLGLELMKLGGSIEGLQLSDGDYSLFSFSAAGSAREEKSPSGVPQIFAEFIQCLKQNEATLLKTHPNIYKIFAAILSEKKLQPLYQTFLTYILDFYPELVTKHAALPLHSALEQSRDVGVFLLNEMQKRKMDLDPEDLNKTFTCLFSRSQISEQEYRVLAQLIETSKELPSIDLHLFGATAQHFNLINHILTRRKDGLDWIIKNSRYHDPSTVLDLAAREGQRDLVLSLLFRDVKFKEATFRAAANCQPIMRAFQELDLHGKNFTVMMSDEKAHDAQTQLMTYLAQDVAPEDKEIIDQLNGLAKVHKGLSPEIIESVIRANIEKLLKPFLVEKKKPGFIDSLLNKPKPGASLLQKLLLVHRHLTEKSRVVLKASAACRGSVI